MTAFRTDRRKKFLELRARYPEFRFEGYEWRVEEEKLLIEYRYSAGDDVSFLSALSIDAGELPEHSFLENLIVNLGMVDLLSYWKSVCSPSVALPSKLLSPEQERWWKTLFFHGLGEFRYRNQIESDIDEFVSFSGSGVASPGLHSLSVSGPLVPIGGGKDSAVTLELLSQASENPFCFLLNPLEAALCTLEVAGVSRGNTVMASRTIDPRLLELNAAGYLNGHTPFSALLAFFSLLGAVLHKKRFIVLSNESSADEGNIVGHEVNHQYSKSLAFESNFRRYVSTFLTKDISYFSFLRPLNELQIAKTFSTLSQHHASFRSCNAGRGRWCGKCPKCLFVAIMLSPFLEGEVLSSIFGKDLFDDPELMPLLLDLAREDRTKPFECVGTREEVQAALNSLRDRKINKKESLPSLLQAYAEWNNTSPSPGRPVEKLLSSFESMHFIPDEYLSILKDSLPPSTQLQRGQA